MPKINKLQVKARKDFPMLIVRHDGDIFYLSSKMIKKGELYNLNYTLNAGCDELGSYQAIHISDFTMREEAFLDDQGIEVTEEGIMRALKDNNNRINLY